MICIDYYSWVKGIPLKERYMYVASEHNKVRLAIN